MSSQCPHIVSAVGPLTGPDLCQLMSVPQCDVCSLRVKNLWLCLYPDCYMLGCGDGSGESKADHSTEHHSKHPDHVIQLNIHSRRAWCYGCNMEIVPSRLIIGSNESVETFGKVLKPKSSDKFVAKPPPAPANESSDRENRKRRHVGGLVGLSNLGNTCYMNAALQCLSNVPPLTDFFLRCPALVNHNNTEMLTREKPSLSKAYHQHVTDLWKTYRKAEGHYIAPIKVASAFKVAHPMFKGFHQHDSQEFLRCFLDQMHEELMEPTLMDTASEDEDLESVSEADSNPDDAKSVQSNDDQGEEQEYETADSGVSEQSSLNGFAAAEIRKRKRKLSLMNAGSADQQPANARPPPADANKRHLSLSEPDMDRGSVSFSPTSASDVELEFADATSLPGSVSSSPPSRALAGRTSSRLTSFPLHRRKPKTYRSVISDIFDGKLVSSVQCLTCNRISTTTEIFQDLSLPITSPENLASIRSQSSLSASSKSTSMTSLTSGSTSSSAAGAANEGWFPWLWSWLYSLLYGPNITLEDCLAYFFSADELKGDNMYSCEKCKKLRNGLKFSRITVLPETLCIHLKRFRHEFAFSSKISTKVTFPLVDLDMSPWLHSNCISKESTYDLIGIICHQGTAGGGHYTSYALNPVNNLWYEYDDSNVTQVDDACVLNAEAYVLFYRKVTNKIEAVRGEVHRLLEEAETQPSLMQFYVSQQWVNKFENFAEPGPIDNSDFLCRHGGVLPQKSNYVYDLCVAFPQPVWQLLHSHFGGGPACNRLYECSQCRNELDTLTRQKTFELEEFKRLHEEFQDQASDTPIVFCLSSSWFKQWEGFVTGRQRDAPGPIDNKGIITTTVTRSPSGAQMNIQSLRHSADFVQISQDIWHLFHSIYGGGPEVILRPNGSSQVRGTILTAAVASRLRAKSLSEMSST